MNILLIGGGGYIGSALTEKFFKENYNVTIFGRSYKKFLETMDIEFVKGDVRDPTSVKNAVKNADIVINLAAVFSDKDASLYDINVLGTRNIIHACLNEKISKFIQCSTAAAIYGNARYLPIDENHPISPRNEYGLSKYLAESICSWYHEKYNIPIVIFRISNAYGISPNTKWTTVVMQFIKNAFEKGEINVLGEGKQVRNFIHFDDLVNFFLHCIKTDVDSISGEILNVAGPEEITMKNLATLISHLVDQKVRINFIPMNSAQRASEIFKFSLSTKKAKEILKYSPKISVQEGIGKIIKQISND